MVTDANKLYQAVCNSKTVEFKLNCCVPKVVTTGLTLLLLHFYSRIRSYVY